MRRHGLLTGSENQRAKAIAADFSKAGIRIARVLIAIVFLLNPVGIIDQLRPVQEMIARGIPVTVAPLAAWSGRIVEFVGGVALIFGLGQRLAALALAAFMVPATWVAHPFWIYFGTSQLQVQLINACKNLAIIGGLIFIASTVADGRTMSAEGRQSQRSCDGQNFKFDAVRCLHR
jgi:putative oxidoreductase